MAFIDSHTLDDGRVIERNLCIVGAVPTGIAIARESMKTGLKVSLLEIGDIAPDDGPEALAAGENVGLSYPPLNRARIRPFGSTTWH